MKKLIAAMLVLAPPAFAQTDEMMTGMKEECAREWHGDFAMQEHCLNRQLRAFIAMHEVYEAERSDDETAILYTCLNEWPRGSGHDWPMVQYCYNRQNAARIRLTQ